MRTIKKLKLILVLIVFSYSNISSQDLLLINNSEFETYLNPALLGSFDSTSRVNIVSQIQFNQELSLYQKGIGVSFDSKIKENSKYKMTLGSFALIHREGSLNSGINEFKVNFSISKKLNYSRNGGKEISIGTSIGISTNRIDAENAQFPTQIPEPNINSRKLFSDLSIGANYSLWNSRHLNFNIGLSLKQLNTPNTSLYSNRINNLPITFLSYANLEIPITSKYSLIPLVELIRQNSSNYKFFAVSNKFYIPSNNSIKYIKLLFGFRHIGYYYLVQKSIFYNYGVEIGLKRAFISSTFQKSEMNQAEFQPNTLSISIRYLIF